MRPTKILQWVFLAGTAAWGAMLAGGKDNGFTTVWTWVFTAMVVVAGLALVLGIVLWVLKALGVIVALPWTPARKFSDRA
ncbi:exported hypothetical protein [uncultured Alphaproteobacteria bacterium]|uniref:Uncharacterized protein n=1 Tax=uncultured Alphaproteobacteria bacterium TaxID=91750 RepID=A0A212KBV2_9PROT|nr:exported hypothetical protein [uncultured Alphaproteobacteria bacterium]